MKIKGIVLSGGHGTRMSPLTKSVNKQLLPIYDKPIIYYSLSILMMAKIKDILIIVNKGQTKTYKKLLPNGKNLGIKIRYKEQSYPRGLPDAFILGKKFIGKNNVALILGDNFFYGKSLKNKLQNLNNLKNGAKIFLHKVKNPKLFGVAKISSKNKIIGIKEKPKKKFSNLAITGLYFFDNKVVNFARKLKPSRRGELEITDLLNNYLRKKSLFAYPTGKDVRWFDTGSIDDYYKTIKFVESTERNKGQKIGCLEEIALKNKWISKKNIISSIKFYGNCSYSDDLKKLI
jgi:glucose-1-phosphate thymidylyltransferase|tara:strand:+ start:1588 stop:2454 length:867 start_codon:yes stop_codon:yes gene_type:complete